MWNSVKASRRKCYLKNREKTLLRMKQDRIEHPEKTVEANRKNYYRHHEQRKASMRQKNQEKRKLILSHYGNICACCGESAYEFLSIDHINNDGAEHRKELFGTKNGRRIGNSHAFYDWVIKNNFPNTLQILCHNCNMAKAFYGYCPHKSNAHT